MIGTEDAQTAESRASVRSRRGRQIMGLVLVLLLLLLSLTSFLLVKLIAVPRTTTPAARVDTGGLTWVRSIYGIGDTAKDQLMRAQAAVSAADGSIWVTDGVHFTLMHFAPDGRFLGQLAGSKDAPLQAPSRIAIGPDGLIYACETSADTVRVFKADGTEMSSFQIPEPVSIAVSQDRIVVGAVSGFAILDKSGKPLRVLGSRGQGDDQFDYVHGVAIASNGNVYVADSYNNRLSAYDPEGNRLWIVRTGKPQNGAAMVNDALVSRTTSDVALADDDSLQLPLGLTIDGADRLVVTDMFGCALAVFNGKDGSFVGKYGDVGAEDGQFFYPVSVSYDPGRDWFTVADALNNRVQIIRLPGSSSGGATESTVRRVLTGPVRACMLPLAVILLALIVAFVLRAVRRRRERKDIDAMRDVGLV
jgi:DNA-binding beta-propeller fold protein YncE